MEPTDKDPPKQQAPADVRGLMVLPWGEVSQLMTWHNSQSQTRGHEGIMPLEEVHGCPPDLPDLYHQGSIALEHAFVDPKALCHCL